MTQSNKRPPEKISGGINQQSFIRKRAFNNRDTPKKVLVQKIITLEMFKGDEECVMLVKHFVDAKVDLYDIKEILKIETRLIEKIIRDNSLWLCDIDEL